MSSTYTTNLNLRKPEYRDEDTKEGWGGDATSEGVLNINFNTIDTAVGSRLYTAENYITDGEPLSDSIDKLDIELKVVADSIVGVIPRKIILSPEYPGGVLWADGAVITAGSLTSDFEHYPLPPPGAGYGYNFYKWVSTAIFQETYWVVVRWRVPESFTGFRTTANKALIVDIATEDTGTNAQIDAAIFKDTGGVPVFSLVNLISSTVAGVWYSERAGNEKVYYDATDPVLASIGAGDVLVMQIAMNSQNNKWSKIQYNG